MFFKTLKHEWILHIRQPMDGLIAWLFFIFVCVLFPLTVSPESSILQSMGPGVIWIAALLAGLLSLPRLFEADYQDGSLDQGLLETLDFTSLLGGKLLAHWLVYSLPLIICTPVMTLLFHLPWLVTNVLIVSLLLGTPILTVQGAVIAALSVGLNRHGIWLAMILLPLYAPIVVMGAAIVVSAMQGFAVSTPLILLASFCVFAITVSPSIIAFSLRTRVLYG